MSVFRDAELQGSAVAIVVLEIQWLMVVKTMQLPPAVDRFVLDVTP